MANLHNAKRALSPVVNIVGEMATWHRAADALLAMNIEQVVTSHPLASLPHRRASLAPPCVVHTATDTNPARGDAGGERGVRARAHVRAPGRRGGRYTQGDRHHTPLAIARVSNEPRGMRLLPTDVAAAVAHACRGVADGSRVATLVVPHDVQRETGAYDAAAVAAVAVRLSPEAKTRHPVLSLL
jgi:thiamine pyrophosphate-dependent acetolactate synthase large subunit-like protein